MEKVIEIEENLVVSQELQKTAQISHSVSKAYNAKGQNKIVNRNSIRNWIIFVLENTSTFPLYTSKHFF